MAYHFNFCETSLMLEEKEGILVLKVESLLVLVDVDFGLKHAEGPNFPTSRKLELADGLSLFCSMMTESLSVSFDGLEGLMEDEGGET